MAVGNIILSADSPKRIEFSTDASHLIYYDSTTSYSERLYNWYAATDARGIAPSGWHLPTSTEMATLATTIGSTLGGGKLKTTGTLYWNSPNTGATNEYGFASKGVGDRDDFGAFGNFKISTRYWNTEDVFTTGGACLITYSSATFPYTVGQAIYKKYGASIRLIKDNSTNSGTMTDYDGNIYNTVTIGSQVWMAANLTVTHYNNGDLISYVAGTSEWAALSTGGWCNAPTS